MTKINRVLLLILMTVEWTMLSEVVRKGYKYKRPYSPVDAVFCFLEKMGLQRAKHSHWTSPLVREMIIRWNKKKKKKLPEVASSLWTSASFMMVRLTETDTHLYWFIHWQTRTASYLLWSSTNLCRSKWEGRFISPMILCSLYKVLSIFGQGMLPITKIQLLLHGSIVLYWFA